VGARPFMARKRGRSPPSGAQYLTTRLCAAFEDDQLHARADHQALPPTLPHAFAEERSYYSSMVQLVLDEAKAMVADGLASSRSSRAVHARLTLENVVRASAHGGGGGLGCMCFEQPRQSSEGDRFRAGSVFLLRSISFGVELLAVVDGRATTCQLECSDGALARCAHHIDERVGSHCNAFQPGSVWAATPVASVLVQQRCIDVCLRRPVPPFMQQLLGGPPPKLATHTRFVDEEVVEEQEEGAGDVNDGSRKGDETEGRDWDETDRKGDETDLMGDETDRKGDETDRKGDETEGRDWDETDRKGDETDRKGDGTDRKGDGTDGRDWDEEAVAAEEAAEEEPAEGGELGWSLDTSVDVDAPYRARARLNEGQQAIVDQLLSEGTADALSLLQGPPGATPRSAALYAAVRMLCP
jgi:hypothetical protein